MTALSTAVERLDWFYDKQVEELGREENQEKMEDWRENSLFVLEEAIHKHVSRLGLALFRGNRETITAECAHIANYAMMVADTNQSRY